MPHNDIFPRSASLSTRRVAFWATRFLTMRRKFCKQPKLNHLILRRWKGATRKVSRLSDSAKWLKVYSISARSAPYYCRTCVEQPRNGGRAHFHAANAVDNPWRCTLESLAVQNDSCFRAFFNHNFDRVKFRLHFKPTNKKQSLVGLRKTQSET